LKIGLSNKRLYNFQMIRLITFLFLIFISTFSIAQEIESGVIAIASNPVKITNAQGEVRIAKTGDKIYLNDTVQTDTQGKTQILLKDQMTISLGPNSQMVVDKFIYDPKEKSKNELSTQIKQGAFKFISGKIVTGNEVLIERFVKTYKSKFERVNVDDPLHLLA
jgi:FecR protein